MPPKCHHWFAIRIAAVVIPLELDAIMLADQISAGIALVNAILNLKCCVAMSFSFLCEWWSSRREEGLFRKPGICLLAP